MVKASLSCSKTQLVDVNKSSKDQLLLTCLSDLMKKTKHVYFPNSRFIDPINVLLLACASVLQHDITT